MQCSVCAVGGIHECCNASLVKSKLRLVAKSDASLGSSLGERDVAEGIPVRRKRTRHKDCRTRSVMDCASKWNARSNVGQRVHCISE